jgi:hypothetical protein
VSAINRAKTESTLDFHPVELSVLELAAHYVFYHLRNRESPVFGRKSKGKYISDLKSFSRTGQKIRIGKKCLSILVRESEIRYGVEEEFAKIIEKMELHNEP